MRDVRAYQHTQTHTASPGELILMLYRGALRFIVAGVEALEAPDLAGAHGNLVRAQAIVAELTASIDVERGGEIAAQLLLLYEYINRRLIEANVSKTAAPAREAEKLLRELLPAWTQVVQEMGAPRNPAVNLAA